MSNKYNKRLVVVVVVVVVNTEKSEKKKGKRKEKTELYLGMYPCSLINTENAETDQILVYRRK